MIDTNPLRDALQKLFDWAREHTSPRDENSPHDLLVQAHAALNAPVEPVIVVMDNSGGAYHEVASTVPIQFFVYDTDVDGMDEQEIRTVTFPNCTKPVELGVWRPYVDVNPDRARGLATALDVDDGALDVAGEAGEG